MATVISISVSKEFDELRRLHRVSWSEAAKIGMSILLAELGVVEYDNRMNLVRKMNKFREIAEAANQKLEELEQKK